MSYQNAFRKAYHGTSKAALASIVANGLVPAGSPGADSWAKYEQKFFIPGRGVFLSAMPTVAAMFSQFAAQVRAGIIGRLMVAGGIVLEIDLLGVDPNNIEEDYAYTTGENNGRALVYHGVIPAKLIRSYCEVTPTAERLPEYPTVEYFDEPDLKLGAPIALGVAA